MFKLTMAGLAAATLLAATPALATTTIEHADGGGFTTHRDAGSAPVGRLTVSSAQTISGFGIDVDLNGLSELTFLIFDSGNGSVLYQSAAKAFTDTGAGYKYSDAFSFTFNPGTVYGLAAWSNTGGAYAVDHVANSVGAFQFLTGNQNVNYNSLDTGTNCCDVSTSLVLSGGSAVPEPTVWAMMITGFGLAGSMLRRRRLALA